MLTAEKKRIAEMEASTMSRADAQLMLDYAATLVNRASVALQRDKEADKVRSQLEPAWRHLFNAVDMLEKMG